MNASTNTLNEQTEATKETESVMAYLFAYSMVSNMLISMLIRLYVEHVMYYDVCSLKPLKQKPKL
jgi:hypothetical protein